MDKLSLQTNKRRRGDKHGPLWKKNEVTMLLTQMVVEITYKLIPFNPLAMGTTPFSI